MSPLFRDTGMRLLALLFAVLTASASFAAVPHRALAPGPSGGLDGGYVQWAAGELLHALQPSPTVQEKKSAPRTGGPAGIAPDAPSAVPAFAPPGRREGAPGPFPARARRSPRQPTGPPPAA